MDRLKQIIVLMHLPVLFLKFQGQSWKVHIFTGAGLHILKTQFNIKHCQDQIFRPSLWCQFNKKLRGKQEQIQTSLLFSPLWCPLVAGGYHSVQWFKTIILVFEINAIEINFVIAIMTFLGEWHYEKWNWHIAHDAMMQNYTGET